MRLIRNSILALAAAGTVLALATPAVSQASVRPAATCTVCRIVIYKGGGNKTPVGPAGPLSSTKWKVSTTPAKIITTNDGTLVEDTSLVWSGGSPGGKWWYDTSQAVLHVFYWDQPGGAGKVEGYGLASLLNDNNAWINLGNGVYSPKCLTWTTSNDQPIYIELNTSTYTWSAVSPNNACGPA